MAKTDKAIYNLPLEQEHWDYLKAQKQKNGASYAWTLRGALEAKMYQDGAELPPNTTVIMPVKNGG